MKFFLCFTFYLFAYTQINNCVAQVRISGSKIKKLTYGSDSFTASMPFMAHEIVYKRKSTVQGWCQEKNGGSSKEGRKDRVSKGGSKEGA
jgi:hypothetical protein